MTTVYNKNGVPFDIDNIATDLNGKADVDLTNVNETGTSKIANCAMPDYSNPTTITVGASGTNYTAPSNGLYVFKFNADAAGRYYALWAGTETTDITKLLDIQIAERVQNYTISALVAKGQKITVSYSGTPASPTGRFYPSIGE